ncbi:hypothetical protein Y032_0090g2344 [Ancylostoma ceylanicum]|uniref:Uncharacterized protein n=1 Tax=Ancylostoma ceylanicum TaxID=53326 RepID=A0A016TNB5_9BILA|nr:hypothetical protein Y032_0090g2344 [Ancylostoma ceylanicum]
MTAKLSGIRLWKELDSITNAPFFGETRVGIHETLTTQTNAANLRAKTCITVDFIDQTGQDKFTRRCCCGGQLAQLAANPALLQGAGVDPIKNGVFVTSVTFAVHCWNQRGEEVMNLLISSKSK